MDETNLLQSLGQVSASETGQIFREFLQGHVRTIISEVMAAEVTELCGSKHAPSEGDCYRSGSSPGRILMEGEREEVLRPRVHRKSENGKSEEVELASYRQAKNPDQLQAHIVQAIVSGVGETLSYMNFPREHWTRIRSNNMLERFMKGIRRRTRVVGAFPEGKSALMLIAVRLRHIAGTKRGTRRYLDMNRLHQPEESTD